jgi:hypothetical protein
MSDNYQDLLKVYKAILDATQEVQKYLRYHSGKYYICSLMMKIPKINK